MFSRYSIKQVTGNIIFPAIIYPYQISDGNDEWTNLSFVSLAVAGYQLFPSRLHPPC